GGETYPWSRGSDLVSASEEGRARLVSLPKPQPRAGGRASTAQVVDADAAADHGGGLTEWRRRIRTHGHRAIPVRCSAARGSPWSDRAFRFESPGSQSTKIPSAGALGTTGPVFVPADGFACLRVRLLRRPRDRLSVRAVRSGWPGGRWGGRAGVGGSGAGARRRPGGPRRYAGRRLPRPAGRRGR